MKPLAVKKEKLKKKEMVEENKKRFWKLGLVFLAVFFVFNLNFSFNFGAIGDVDDFFNLNIASAQTDLDSWATNTTDEQPRPLDSKGGGTSLNPIKWLVYGIFKLMIWLLGAATVLFGWVVDPEKSSFILGNAGLYASWAMVRDFLNLGFILVLLYIAFCVIFQIGSYSDGWKKMLLMMVIMALLVNFSFPICRFIIDVSNIIFYYILNSAFPGMGGSGILTKFTAGTGFADILDVSTNSDWGYLFAAIVFTFILAITFLVIAVLFIIRMVALGILVIFSPIGFAGAAFPFSKKYAEQWWDELFKNAFFAPIMMFMIVIAMNIMNYSNSSAMNLEAQNNLGVDSGVPASFLGTMAFFSIPIVILWFGMIVAQKLKIVGAATVTGMAQSTAKWAGKQTYQAPWKGIKMASRASGLTGGVSQKLDRISRGFKSAQASREARIAAAGPGFLKDPGALERDMKRRSEEYKKETISESELKTRARRGDAAAAYRLAEDKNMEQADYTQFMATRPNAAIMGAFNSKVKQSRVDLVATYNADNMTAQKMDEIRNADPARQNWSEAQIRQHSINQEIGKMSADKWNDQDWGGIADQVASSGDTRVQLATANAFSNMRPQAQNEIRTRLNANNASTLSARMNVPV